MGSEKPGSIPAFFILFMASSAFHVSSESSSALYNLIYKGCSNQDFTDPHLYQQNLASLLNSLVAKSASTKYFKDTFGSGQTSISGLFQCRGDLSNDICYSCVKQLSEKTNQLCGNAMSGRLQFTGCYLHYETSGFPEISGMHFLYKWCSSSLGKNGFEEKRDTALANVQSGVLSSNNLFYASGYGDVYALAQCEGVLSPSDCGACIQAAIQKAEVECGGAGSGQVFLNRCYVSYSFHGSGVSGHSSSGQKTGKTVAIVVGGVAAAAFLVIFALFIRSSLKKHDDN